MTRFARTLAAGAIALGLAACEREHRGSGTAEAEAVDANAPAEVVNEVPLAKAASDPSLEWGPCPEGMPQGCGIAVLHGEPGKPNADIFLRVPGGSAIPPHSHTSAERMILVSGELETLYQGHPAATLRAGSYAYGPAKMPHRATCRSSEPCTLFIAFEGPVDVVPFEGDLN